jgi:hypothetical protein
MSQTLTISDQLHTELEAAARARGFDSIERLLEYYQASDEELRRRQEVVRRIDEIRTRIYDTYGEMPDSTALIREDRER